MNNDTLSGTVVRLLYNNTENGFTVFVVQTAQKKEITVKGCVATITPGERVTLRGAWVTHPKFGKQLEIHECTSQVPTSLIGLERYLASGLIKGIGKVYAKKLVDRFGHDVLTIIDEQPERLREVPGVGAKRLESIIAAWQDQRAISQIMVFLQDKGLSPAYAVRIYKKYGNRSIEKVTENPYVLAHEVRGIGFKIADSIAQNMGFAHDSIKRIIGGLLFCVQEAIGYGNLYCELDTLKEKTIILLELDHAQVSKKVSLAFHDLYEKQIISLVTHEEKHFVTLAQCYFTEKGIAQKIALLQENASRFSFEHDEVMKLLQSVDDGITLHQEQIKGIFSCVQNKVSIVTGGPGTGKTTLVKKLLAVLDKYNVTYKLAAPTGRAAKRMAESTGKRASTIHMLLEFDPRTMSFARNEQYTLKTNFLIIDEASMIDVYLANSLLKAVAHNTHVVFLGDIDQLPSVGPGNVLKDLIASNVVSCVRLQRIFRQAQDSLIVINAHKINQGEFPTASHDNAKKDFLLIKEPEPMLLKDRLVHIYRSLLPRHGIALNNAITLVPMNRGIVGTQVINDVIQEIVNSGDKPKIMYGGTTYKVGDHIMQITNNYDKHVFNGDIGVIGAIDMKEREIEVIYPEKSVVYKSTEFDELMLAYAVSIHKSQGSEFDAVIVPLYMHHFTLLQRNLVYTAITRAKKLCILMGQTKAIAIGIKNDKGVDRKAFLKEYLTTDLKAR